MLEALCGISILGFLQFLNSAVFAVGYISRTNLFPEPLTHEEEEKIFKIIKARKWRRKKYINWKKFEISCTCCKKISSN